MNTTQIDTKPDIKLELMNYVDRYVRHSDDWGNYSMHKKWMDLMCLGDSRLYDYGLDLVIKKMGI